MRTPAEVSRLIAAAESWRGTPFCPNSAVKGAGVCCHKYCGMVYMEAGWFLDFEMPDGDPYGSSTASVSPFEPWLDASPLFANCEGPLEPGDLLLSKPSRLPWHLAIFLGDGVYAHVDLRQGVQVTNTFPDVWAKRVVRTYRPVNCGGYTSSSPIPVETLISTETVWPKAALDRFTQ